MTISRRRFMTLSACALVAPAMASAETWRGRAFGADVSVTLNGPGDRVAKDLEKIVGEIARLERRFSLFDPSSEICQLNTRGRMAVSDDMYDILLTARRVHQATGGFFDPTVQRLWQALAQAEPLGPAISAIGFSRIRIGPSHVALDKGQALTLNGIAQGFATDRIADLLKRRGYGQALVNIGEYAAVSGPFELGIADPEAGFLGKFGLTDMAVATSSPGAMRVGGSAHILHPWTHTPLWSTVTVEAQTAALADACSTAFCLMSRPQIEKARQALGLSRIWLVDQDGGLARL